jgi:unsaturated chondroitin disaccharide hydrolase
MTPTELEATTTRDVFTPALEAALSTVARNVAAFGDRYPDDTTAADVYPVRAARGSFPEGSNHGWTTSFWPGMVWLAYEHTGDDTYRRAGERHVRSFADRVGREIDLDTHDLGFLYTLACVAPWKLTGNAQARQAALDAAEHLMERFLEPAGIIQAWGDLTNPEQRGRTIVDSLMNMPLLYWASEETGDPRFRAAAQRHTTALRDHIIRPDNTTFHTFYWDPVTGEPLRGGTEQGYADGSCWARGQAWGIYGFALNFRHTGDESFLIAAQRCADYFLDHLPADHVAYWDLAFADGSGEERDSSAAAIAVCGLDELASWLPDGPRKQRYLQAARDILTSLGARYSTAGNPDSNALLLHGIYDKPKQVGVDEGTLWGDYFYLEALTRALHPAWISYW